MINNSKPQNQILILDYSANPQDSKSQSIAYFAISKTFFKKHILRKSFKIIKIFF